MASHNFTRLPASADGPAPSVRRDGLTTSLSGPAPVLANPSRSPVKGSVLLMNGTYGPTFCDSSAPPVLKSAWESKLLDRLATVGSTEWWLIWKRKITPAGMLISRLAVLTARKDGIGSTGWPTPNRATGGPNTKSTTKHIGGMDLDGVAQIASWPTPASRDWRDGRASDKTHDRNARPLNEVAAVAVVTTNGWVSPTKTDSRRGAKASRPHDKGIPLTQQVGNLVSGWATPDASVAQMTEDPTRWADRRALIKVEKKNGNGMGIPLAMQARTAILRTTGTPPPSSAPTATDDTAVLNPELPAWLLGFPDSWLRLAPTAEQMNSRKLQ